jgi:type I restriction enzyme S subunit
MEEVKTIFVEGSYSHKIEIPSSWEFAPLHEVIELVGGSQPPKSVFKYEPEDGYVRLIQIRDYKSDDHKVYIPRDLARRFVGPDEVMIGRYGPPIFQILRGLEGAYNVALMKAVPVCDVFSKDYLFKYLSNKDLYNYVDSASDRTAGQSGVNKEHLEKYPVAVPPLAEQQQIAQKLDELLAQVDTLKTRLDAIPKILKRFRQSVLAAAVSGRLTEEWRGENKEILKDFESYKLGENLPQSWKVVPLGDYMENWDNSRSPISSSERISRQGQYPYYGASGVIDSIDGYTHDGNFVLIGEDGANLVTRTKPIAFSAKGKVWVNNHAHVLRCKDGYENLYFEHYINSIDLTPWVSGSAQPKLNQKNMNQIPIPVPPKTEQTEIVRRVEQLFTYADQIEQRVKDAQARVNHLTQSILAKAFRGELTADWRAQNPELISGENSAAALLERIRVEREVVGKSKRKSKA